MRLKLNQNLSKPTPKKEKVVAVKAKKEPKEKRVSVTEYEKQTKEKVKENFWKEYAYAKSIAKIKVADKLTKTQLIKIVGDPEDLSVGETPGKV